MQSEVEEHEKKAMSKYSKLNSKDDYSQLTRRPNRSRAQLISRNE
jgi:hypothetical protein